MKLRVYVEVSWIINRIGVTPLMNMAMDVSQLLTYLMWMDRWVAEPEVTILLEAVYFPTELFGVYL